MFYWASRAREIEKLVSQIISVNWNCRDIHTTHFFSAVFSLHKSSITLLTVLSSSAGERYSDLFSVKRKKKHWHWNLYYDAQLLAKFWRNAEEDDEEKRKMQLCSDLFTHVSTQSQRRFISHELRLCWAVRTMRAFIGWSFARRKIKTLSWAENSFILSA